MSTFEEIRENRIEKRNKLEKLGINPYPISIKRTHKVKEILDDFDIIQKEETEVVLVGRIKTMRSHGALTFFDFEDGTGKMQAMFASDRLGENNYRFFLDNFDSGDFIEIKGVVFKTKREEKTIEGRDFKMISKSLRPLPEKWHGLKDVEERYRKRYLDLIFSPEIKNNFEIRSKIVKEIRNFLDKNDFFEVETPILQTIYGGARAKPFKTHINAFDLDVFLRISPELYLKRLIIGGFEKVYEIGRCFRNEGVDKFHNPDFTMLEFYWAYADYKELMKLTEKLIQKILKNVLGTTSIKYGEKIIDFSGRWERIEFFALLEKYTGIKYEEINENALLNKARELGIEIPKGADKANIADEIYKKYCRSKIINPTFIIHHPYGFQPLAKNIDNDKLASFQVIVAGAEIINAFSELNDPVEQSKRFKEQERMFKGGFEEAQRSDEEFIEALEHGMPPVAGFGLGIDRFVSIITNSNSLREVILFPLMKPKE
jgi:lysyl-tRNA synthetase class 2